MFSTYDPHAWEDSFDLEAGDPEDDFCEDCEAASGRYCEPCRSYLAARGAL